MRPSLKAAILSVAGASASSGVEASTREIALPHSDVYETQDLFNLRRLRLGGQLARSYFTVVVGGTTYAVHYRQGDATANTSSGADPTVHVAALSGATAVEVDLGSSNNTAAQVRTATISALAGAGITATANGTDSEGRAQMVINGATSLGIPTAVDLTDNRLRGMYGSQREDWGAGAVTQNLDGGTNGTGSIHVGNPSDQSGMTGRDGRILGVYIWGHTAHRPLLAAATGPVYSTSPTAMTMLGEAAIASGGLTQGPVGYVLFDEPVAFDSADELWWFYRENVAGGPRYRAHGVTPQGSGDVPVSQQLVWHTSAITGGHAYTTSFGSSYTPVADSTFSIYILGGLIFELQDASGNYHAAGDSHLRIGDQTTDDERGTQFSAGAGLLDQETTHHRFILPNQTSLPVTAISRAFDGMASGESCRVAAYGPWADLNFPATTPPALINDFGILGDPLTANDFNVLTVSPAVDVSAAADDYWSIGFNYTTATGVTLATMALPVYLDVSTGDGSYRNCWDDTRTDWHDDISGASGYSVSQSADRAPTSGVSEYRTTNTTMPHDDYDDAWPDPLETDATDDSPNALAIDYVDFTWVGFAEVAA